MLTYVMFPWQITVLLRLSEDLLGIVGRGHGQGAAQQPEEELREEQEAELAINRQTALYSLKLLCRRRSLSPCCSGPWRWPRRRRRRRT